MFCGARTLRRVKSDPFSPRALPRASMKKSKKKIPCPSRGFGRFLAMLSELKSKKEKIAVRAGSKAVLEVKFMSSSNEERVMVDVSSKALKINGTGTIEGLNSSKETDMSADNVFISERTKIEEKEGEALSWRRLWQSWSWSLVVILMLVCLVMFGKVFAICCTSMWWYLAPSRVQDLTEISKS